MKLTSDQRRKRIYEIAEADEEYQKIKARFDRAKYLFDQYCLTLPAEQRDLLQSCPGMGYFLHSKMLSLVCEQMQFADESDRHGNLP